MTIATPQTCPACSAELVIESLPTDAVILCAGCGTQFRPNGEWPVTRTSRRAIASFVLGFLSIGGLCLTAVPALFLGLWALRDIRHPRNAEILSGKRLAITGASLGAFFSLAMFALPLLALIQIQRAVKIDELERTAQRCVHDENWSEAADHYRQILDLAPNNEMYWLCAATINAQADAEEYHRLCDEMLLQFEKPNSVVAERIAKACLLLPPTPARLDTAFRLAEQAVKQDPKHELILWFEGTRALARYRRGDFDIAIESCNKCRLGDPSDSIAARAALASFVESAAHFRSGAEVEAREALERGRALLNKSSASDSWHDLLIARLMWDEAAQLAASAEVDTKDR
jgi:tetratricopeptide (TPR) repeat protein